MKRSLKETIIRIIVLFCGLTIAHLGVTLFLLADLGSDPFNVLVQGIFRSLSEIPLFHFLTHGYTHMGLCFIIMIVLLFVDKNYIKIGTIICMFCGGPIIDFFTWMLQDIINSNNPFIMRLITLVLGCIILAYGMTVVMKSDAGVGPNDLVAISISDKGHFPFGRTRIVVDVCFVIFGFLLSGSVGLGTVICAFLVGPVADLFLPFNGKLVDAIIRKF